MVKMQNVAQGSTADNPKLEKVNVQHGVGNSSTPHSATSSPAKSETETYSEHPRFMSDSSESEEDSVSEVESFIIDRTELDEDTNLDKSKFLLNPDESDRTVDPETQARLEALLHAAGNGISQLATKDGKNLADPEVLRRLTSSVSCALDEAAAALTRMRTDNPRNSHSDKTSLVDACTDGDVGTVRKLLTEGRSVHETTEEGESLLSLACSAGYFELAQVLLAMHANVEDRGIKGECTPLMEAASAGHLDIVRLLIAHGADVNAQSNSGNTPLMYACAGGHEDAVETLLEAGANVEDHNENGHTPLMEAASAGHVNVAKILLRHGAGINTHSNEFKESALTLACYKGHLDMVRFLLDAGADQEHKTDEMHTALMEASMDGHVEVARLLLDSGAQVNMPTDSFESPLTLAACGGHVDLAMLLIERGANIEEVNDEGYTPLMEAAREGHEEMVALLLSQGANINAQTDETQETALTLACCGGFSEVADFLIKAGADIELGASTPLMEAAQEGHIELVKYLLHAKANVHAQTQTGDTALTYACENGHTDVADLLLECNADLEHESEGGRTPLMKACRAGHLCTVQFLISKGANVNRQTTNNDHTPLSLACAGGHLAVVQLLLSHSADPFHKLKDNSTMLIEAAKGGHTSVVQLLLDYPHSIMMASSHPQQSNVVSNMIPTNLSNLSTSLSPAASQALVQPTHPGVPTTTTADSLSCAGLHEVPEAVRIVAQEEGVCADSSKTAQSNNAAIIMEQFMPQPKHTSGQKSLLRKNRSAGMMFDGSLTSAEAQQVRSQPLSDLNTDLSAAAIELLPKDDGSIIDKGSGSILEFIKARTNKYTHEECVASQKQSSTEEQQILDEIYKAEREYQVKELKAPNHLLGNYGMGNETIPPVPLSPNSLLPGVLNLDLASHAIAVSQGMVCGGSSMSGALFQQATSSNISVHNAFYAGKSTSQVQPLPISTQYQQSITLSETTFAPSTCTTAPTPLGQQTLGHHAMGAWPQQSPAQSTSITTSPADVSQNTAISDRPKAKPVSKKEGKNLRKQQAYQALQQQQQLQSQQTQQQQQQQTQQQQQFQQQHIQQVLQQQAELDQGQEHILQVTQTTRSGPGVVLTAPIMTHILESSLVQNQGKTSQQRILQPGETTDLVGLLSDQDTCQLFTEAADKSNLVKEMDPTVEDVVQTLETISLEDVANVAAVEQEKLHLASVQQAGLQVQTFPTNLDEAISAITAAHNSMQVSGATQTDIVRTNYTDLQVQHSTGLQFQYEQYLQSVTGSDQCHNSGAMYQAGFQAGIQLCQEMHLSKSSQLTCPGNVTEAITTTIASSTAPQVVTVGNTSQQYTQPTCTTHQVATQTQQPLSTTAETKGNKGNKSTTTSDVVKVKKGRLLMQRQQTGHGTTLPQQNGQFSTGSQNFPIDPNAVPQYNTGQAYPTTQLSQTSFSCMDVDSETDSNHDTALTLACAGGHEDLVELLLSRGADIEHRDKKGFTPLILAATAGHEKVVEILLNHGADIEAQSERTKDTPLSLACSGGRYEVVELLLSRGANREHRNVSDYTPLSLAASGGYVNIIKLLLNHGAEINSRTGSKLGISPLMLAAMNGHTAAVKLLLDMGSDINAQIETNRNTALTLACFQGRHEVVSLLLDRRANVEHRAKTGLTPLMEAASGGYVEVGRVLLDKGADVNATPVPSSRDTALTIAADKGHCRFVELLLSRGAAVEVKNKKGNSPLWLAANGGHLSVVELLYNASADIDSQDNRKVSCLMAAFRKGHTKVVKWMVNHVTQFPSDQEMMRYIATVSDKDKELLEKCQECVKIIKCAKETQAAKANKNATILLEELDMEKNREESKKAAAARRRERKKKKKLEKKEEKRKLFEENKKNENYDDKDDKKSADEVDKADEDEASGENTPGESPMRNGDTIDKEEGDSGIDANSQGSCSSNDVKAKEKRKEKKKKKSANQSNKSEESVESKSSSSSSKTHSTPVSDVKERANERRPAEPSSSSSESSNKANRNSTQHNPNRKSLLVFEASRHPADRDDFESTGNEAYVSSKGKRSYMHYESDNNTKSGSSTSPKQTGKREEGWKEVVRKSSVQAISSSESGAKKVSVPLNAISRVIGRGGSNINAIRGATGAHIEVEKQSKGQGERIITIKGSADACRQAHMLIAALIKDPDVDILQMLPRTTKTIITSSLWDKTNAAMTAKKNVKVVSSIASHVPIQGTAPKVSGTSVATTVSSTVRVPTCVKMSTSYSPSVTRGTAPRLAEVKRLAAQMTAITKNTMSYTTAIMTAGRGSTKVVTTTSPQTFAAKLTETSASGVSSHQQSAVPISQANKVRTSQTLNVPQMSSTAPTSPQASNPPAMTTCTTTASPKHHRPQPTASAPPSIHHYQIPGKAPFSHAGATPPVSEPNSAPASTNTTTPATSQVSSQVVHSQSFSDNNQNNILPQQTVTSSNTTLEYSLFNDSFTKVAQQSMWGRENDSKPNFAAATGGGMSSQNSSVITSTKYMTIEPPQVDASKAPGYRGNAVCSPVSSKTSSNSTTPPSISLASGSGYHNFLDQSKAQPIQSLSGIGLNRPLSRPGGLELHSGGSVNQANSLELACGRYVNRTHIYPGADLPVRSSEQGDSSNLYKSASASSFTADSATNLLKMVPDDQQSHNLMFNMQQPNMPHQMSYSQPQQSGQVNNNTTVSMSRLNPRAPDFSMHNMSNKQNPQPTVAMFNASNFHHTGVISANQPSNPNPVIGNNNVPYPLKSSLDTYQQPNRSNSGTGQAHWPYINPGYHPSQQRQQPDVMVPMHRLRGLTSTSCILSRPTAPIDLLENGGMCPINNSPNMSPNSPTRYIATTGDGHHKMEDRKIPQPIGTERASWKIQNSNLPNSDPNNVNWILGNESKLAMGSWNASCLAPNLPDRQPPQQQQQQQQPYIRSSYDLMNCGDEITHMMDSYQHGGTQLDSQHAFQNGAVAIVSPLLQQHFGLVGNQDVIQTDPMKMDMPNWDGSRMTVSEMQDKQQSWKWN